MKSNRICSCGLLVAAGTKCSCHQMQKSDAQKDHPSGTWNFQKLRKKIILRDKGHCQRCRILFDTLTTEDLECHHIKSYRDFPELARVSSNLIMVCKPCNSDLGNSNKLDFEFAMPGETEYFL